MVDVKVSELTEATSVTDDDLFLITDNPGGVASSKKITFVNVISSFLAAIDADDIDDSATTNKFVTSADITKLNNLSGTNTGDQNLFSTVIVGTDTITASNSSDTLTFEAGTNVTLDVDSAGVITVNAAISGINVESVNGIAPDSTGDVTITADDIDDSGSTNKFVTSGDLTKLSNTSGTNTGDQNLFSTIAVSGQTNVVADSASDTLTFVAGTGVTITTDATTDTITFNTSGEANTMSNVGLSGEGIYKQKTGVDFELKKLVAGSNVTITGGTNDITITGATPGETNTMSNVGASGVGIYKQKTGVDFELKKLVAGSNVTITGGTNDITITGGAGGASYTDEEAQDAVGGILTDTATIDFTYNDTLPGISADIKDGSVTLAKMANTTQYTLYGRSTSGSGAPETISSSAAVYGLLDDTSEGAMRTTLGLGTIATQNANSVTLTGGNATLSGGTFTTLSVGGNAIATSGASTVSGANTGDQNLFSTVAVSGQTSVAADSTSDTLTLANGTGIGITTNATTDTITVSITDAELVAIAGLTSAADKAPYFTGSGTADLMTVTSAARTVLSNTTVGAMLTALGGQPLDATLTGLAGLDTVVGAVVQTGTDTFTKRVITNGGGLTITNGDGVSGNPTIAMVESMIIAISDESTALTTGTAKVTFRMPYAFTLTAVRASLSTVSSSGAPTFDINENGTSVLGTKLSIDANEKTSTTAASAATITDSSLADDAEITIDIDTAGTGAKGAKIYLIGYRT